MNNIRKRLVVWYTGILAVLLLAFTAGLYLFLKYHLNAEVDSFLISWTAHAGESLDGDGRIINDPVKAGEPHLMSRLNMNESFALVLDSAYAAKQSALSRHSLQQLIRFLISHPTKTQGSFGTIFLDSQLYRIYATDILQRDGQPNKILVLGRSLIHVQNTLAGLRNFLAIAWGLAVFACIFISWIFVGWTLLPVKRMTRDSLQIAASRELGRRIENLAGNDEFGELSQALNCMLASLETSAVSQKKFLADASHELRTPLTSMIANLDFLARAVNAPESEKRAALQDSITETKRMATLVNELLALSRSEAISVSLFAKTNLADIIRDVSEHYQTKYTQVPRILVKVPDSVYIKGDPEKLRQMTVILLDNAFKYAGEFGEVELHLHKQMSGAAPALVLEVCDNGPGIPEDEIPLVFDRFYRASNVRNITPGSGLGLSIAQTIVQNHGGNIELSNNMPHGLKVAVSFPAAG